MSYGLLAFAIALLQLQGTACLNFSFSSFPRESGDNLNLTGDAYVVKDAIQVTRDVRGASIENLKGRAYYRRQFRLWRRHRDQSQNASFNSTFVLNITPQTHPGGEGLAFILSGDDAEPPLNSEGQWLGIANATTNGTAAANVVAVEFDTRKSFPQDLDDNHVGLNVNSVYSIVQRSLWDLGVNASNGTDFTVTVEYDGGSKNLTVYVGDGRTLLSNDSLAFSRVVDLPSFLPEDVYVGFSASTGKNSTQLNCVRAWDFTGTDMDEDTNSTAWLRITIPVAIVCSLGVGLAVICCYCCYRRRQFKKIKEEEEEGGEEDEYSDDDQDPMLDAEIEKSGGARKFRLKEIETATENFAGKNEVGRGGCGTVYRGVLVLGLGDGNHQQAVAVKRFAKRSAHGRRDFVAEVKTIGKLHHKNLVKLVGWCHEGGELLLVYEFMPNGSLDAFIFPTHPWSSSSSSSREVPLQQQQQQQQLLPWETRHRIICDVATALDYLHTGCDQIVLHRDIKASNILLDSHFNARLGDFGLARTIHPSLQTHHSTSDIAGTPGYMAPESFHIGRATPETDVYAFGVVALEVVCGRKPGRQSEGNSYNNGIVEWAWQCHNEGRVLDVVDGGLKTYDADQVKRTLVLGLACCHPNPHCRPSIKTALQVLLGEAVTPPIPVKKPTFMWPATPVPDDDQEVIDQYTSSFTGGQLSPSTTLSAR